MEKKKRMVTSSLAQLQVLCDRFGLLTAGFLYSCVGRASMEFHGIELLDYGQLSESLKIQFDFDI